MMEFIKKNKVEIASVGVCYFALLHLIKTATNKTVKVYVKCL